MTKINANVTFNGDKNGNAKSVTITGNGFNFTISFGRAYESIGCSTLNVLAERYIGEGPQFINVVVMDRFSPNEFADLLLLADDADPDAEPRCRLAVSYDEDPRVIIEELQTALAEFGVQIYDAGLDGTCVAFGALVTNSKLTPPAIAEQVELLSHEHDEEVAEVMGHTE